MFDSSLVRTLFQIPLTALALVLLSPQSVKFVSPIAALAVVQFGFVLAGIIK